MFEKQTIKLNVRPLHKLPKGHPVHRSGAGVHADRRLKRQRTRQAQIRASLKE